eukprot:1139136-Pelagomonas_calceolata.AAC.4
MAGQPHNDELYAHPLYKMLLVRSVQSDMINKADARDRVPLTIVQICGNKFKSSLPSGSGKPHFVSALLQSFDPVDKQA